MALVTCAKCEGHGFMVRSPYHPDYGFRLLPVTCQDVTTRHWYTCPTCRGIGTLEVQPRAEVWDRVAEAGIELLPELREEGDLGYAGESGTPAGSSGDVASCPS